MIKTVDPARGNSPRDLAGRSFDSPKTPPAPAVPEDAAKADFKYLWTIRGEYWATKSTGRQVRTAAKDFVDGFRKFSGLSPERESLSMDSADIWNRLRNMNPPTVSHARDLAELILRNDDQLPEYIALELEKERNEFPLWRNEIIFAAEHVEILDGNLRNRIASALLARALEMRSASNPETHEALWAALRRYSSLVLPEDSVNLGQFLTPRDHFVTWQVCLRGIRNVFLHSPPSEVMQRGILQPMYTRVLELGKKYLDPDILTPGDNSALAMSAYDAIAVIASQHLREYSTKIKELGKNRLIRRASSAIREILDSWINSGVEEAFIQRIRESSRILG